MKRKIRIGILGGGQLARMSALEAIRMNLEVLILEKELDSPAGMLTKNEFKGWVDDLELVKAFSNDCDVITLENEFIDYKVLELIEDMGKPVFPSSRTISLIQDKYIQKNTFLNAGLPIPKFIDIFDRSTYSEISRSLGEKFLLKSRTMGYDGYGNATITNELEFLEGLKKLESRSNRLMAEQFVDFERELAIMVVRTSKEFVCYPVVETIQENHICKTVIAPADLSKDKVTEIESIAKQCLEAISGYGIFGIELFIDKNENIYINEIAPRPHNSGHYTIDACVTSQFENHIRSILDLPLGSCRMRDQFAVMVNLLGKTNGLGNIHDYNSALNDPDTKLHIYGKKESRIGRKMGHITITGSKINDILDRIIKIEKEIVI